LITSGRADEEAGESLDAREAAHRARIDDILRANDFEG
jgi:hypothetical protein